MFGSRRWIYQHCYIKFKIKQNTQIALRALTGISSMSIVGQSKAFSNSTLITGFALHRCTKLRTDDSHQYNRCRLLSTTFCNCRHLLRCRVTYTDTQSIKTKLSQKVLALVYCTLVSDTSDLKDPDSSGTGEEGKIFFQLRQREYDLRGHQYSLEVQWSHINIRSHFFS